MVGCACCVFTCVLVLLLATAPTGAINSDIVPGHYIVSLRRGIDPGKKAREARSLGARVDHTFTTTFRGYAGAIPQAILPQIQNDPDVDFVEPDRTVFQDSTSSLGHHADPRSPNYGQPQTLSDSWIIPEGVHFAGLTTHAALRASADAVAASGRVLAIIDSGLGVNDDINNSAGGYNCARGKSTNYNDGNGHGTHVAGTASAGADPSGYAGMAPNAPVFAARVLQKDGSGQWSWVICGIEESVRRNASVINLSLGGSCGKADCSGRCNSDCTGCQSSMHQAICEAELLGTLVVVAAGNSNDDVRSQVPAAYEEPLTVAAVADSDGIPGATSGVFQNSCWDGQPEDGLASFSNYGSGIDIAASGVCVSSTLPGDTYGEKSGTSMSSPHVAGAAVAVMAKLFPDGTRSAFVVQQTKAALLGSARPPSRSGYPELDLSTIFGRCQSDSDCDDNNGCTSDRCDTSGLCSNEFELCECDDLHPCTNSFQCTANVCINCDSVGCSEPCTQCSSDGTCVPSCTGANSLCDEIGQCVACLTSDDCPSFGSQCLDGQCIGCSADGHCNDNDPCTIDKCIFSDGTCSNPWDAVSCCDDLLAPCSGLECDPVSRLCVECWRNDHCASTSNCVDFKCTEDCPELAEQPDGICQPDLGENCINSPDVCASWGSNCCGAYEPDSTYSSFWLYHHKCDRDGFEIDPSDICPGGAVNGADSSTTDGRQSSSQPRVVTVSGGVVLIGSLAIYFRRRRNRLASQMGEERQAQAHVFTESTESGRA